MTIDQALTSLTIRARSAHDDGEIILFISHIVYAHNDGEGIIRIGLISGKEFQVKGDVKEFDKLFLKEGSNYWSADNLDDTSQIFI